MLAWILLKVSIAAIETLSHLTPERNKMQVELMWWILGALTIIFPVCLAVLQRGDARLTAEARFETEDRDVQRHHPGERAA
ncbi:MAG: hypothetical protein AB1540_03590 [Bdellovibrionota bacterium]